MQLKNSQWAAGFYKAIILFPGVQLCPKEWAIQKKKLSGWLPNQTAPSSHFQLRTSEAE